MHGPSSWQISKLTSQLKLRHNSTPSLSTTMARRLYLGSTDSSPCLYKINFDHRSCCAGLPPDARSEDVAKFFDGYGRIIDCRVMTGSSDKRRGQNSELTGPPSGFGFVEFESSKVDLITMYYGE